ncbi:MAG: fumarylacetoacetate hydrolase family protein [Rhodoferax sp.]|nr:fumarylacetoacetate hydrolase family protein [Rhodoferax sp.]MCF8209336.1 fumarylacetoacetate hydrolase family protein [Rhodoferax sp.]
MKLASYKDGSRDGQLVVVSRDLSQAHYASHIASRVQSVLDDWNYLSPQLQDMSDALNSGRARHAFAFDARQCMAPLPRAFQWVEGMAYGSHLELLQQAHPGTAQGAGDAVLMWQGSGDWLLGPCDPMVCSAQESGVDFGAGLAVVTGDLPMACTPERALDGVRLILLVNSWRLRCLAPDGAPYGAMSLSAWPASTFSPVAVTPDELGDAWARGRVQGALQVCRNGRKVGVCDTGSDMTHSFGKMLAHLCQTRGARAGSILGSGPVSNRGVARKGRTDWPNGYSCIAEKRAMETLLQGQPETEYLRFGDNVRIEMKGRDGHSIFGAIDQDLVSAAP